MPASLSFPTDRWSTVDEHIERILFVRQHPDEAREIRAREIAEWMGKPLEIHDLGIRPLEELLTPLMTTDDEETTDVRP